MKMQWLAVGLLINWCCSIYFEEQCFCCGRAYCGFNTKQTVCAVAVAD
ncbi:MAG: hypothetical protein KatS3mg087_0831 [Patescibacteria group bacterium]|nr:MAG: hypothetical protein KatS3mg087_0831 [Patescibacteria group bacterium]